jgi:hypothetical protein
VQRPHEAVETEGDEMNLHRTILLVTAVAVAVAASPVALAGSPTPAELNALEIRGQALTQACLDPIHSRAAYQALCTYIGAENQATRAGLSNSSGFDWGDFGIGAGAMLGLALLLGGTAAAVHYGRRSSVRPRTVS